MRTNPSIWEEQLGSNPQDQNIKGTEFNVKIRTIGTSMNSLRLIFYDLSHWLSTKLNSFPES